MVEFWVFNRSNINKLIKKFIENGNLKFPPSEPLPNRPKDLPYVIVGDDAIPSNTSP